MKYLTIRKDFKISQLAMGCMRFANSTVAEMEVVIKAALDNGINFFDHADIYGNGKCEELFGHVLVKYPNWRKKIFIQSKCGIVKGKPITTFDFSKQHIIESVNGSLRRLQTKYLDVLLLHRPDTLFDPKEVASAFNQLSKTKKVKYFGVSNFNPMQIKLLQKYVKQPILFNQLQLSPVHSDMMSAGLFVNMKEPQGIVRDGSILEYCRLKDITIQPWSIVQASWAEGSFLNHKNYPELNQVLDELANKYKVTPSGVVIAWLIRHPANMQPIFGTTKAVHLKEMCAGCNIYLTRLEWYRIYTAAIKRKLP